MSDATEGRISAQQATALLSRARYAHQHGEPVRLSLPEIEFLGYALADVEPWATLYGVPVEVALTLADSEAVRCQIEAALIDPAPPMEWETSGGGEPR